MAAITATKELVSFLSPLQQTTEIRDAQGQLLGIFTPQAVAEEERLKSLFDLDEAQHVLATERHAGRPLHEIRRDLERRRAPE